MTEINLPKFRGENHGDLPILEANLFLHVGTSLVFPAVFLLEPTSESRICWS